ncbi:MAG: hypothetical protein MZU91_13230 [Desulfosudis oleivorans]|nr:hypothetical protein [Desulfosudis oleivorans]
MTDNSAGLVDGHMVHRFGQGEWLDLTGTKVTDGHWSMPIPVPFNSTEPLQFNFTATDQAGNNALSVQGGPCSGCDRSQCIGWDRHHHR